MDANAFARGRTLAALLLLLVAPGSATRAQPAADSARPAPRELRVCADPNNLPFSNQRLEGFENKIATLIAGELHATLSYDWRPQRRAFVRRTLNAHRCDLIVDVPSTFDLVLPTKPFYRSTYVFVYAKSRGLHLQSLDDPVLRRLRIGVHAIGDDYANTPPAQALARRHIVDNVVGYSMFGDSLEESPPAKIIDAVAAGEIDVAIVWGPYAGYFAKRESVPLAVVPVAPSEDPPGQPFAFDMSIGVRHGDEALKRELEEVLDRRRDAVRQILRDFGVPLVDSTELHAARQ